MDTNSYIMDVVYRNLTTDPVEGVLSCGFMPKNKEIKHHYFMYYGGFLILSGKGKYIDQFGEETSISKGDFVQRRPGVKHITIVEEGQPWIEFFLCIGPKLYRTLVELQVITDDPIIHTVLSSESLKRCEELLYSFKTNKDLKRESLLMKAQSFLFYINRISQESQNYNVEQSVIELVCDRLTHNFDEKVDVKKIALNNQIGYESLRKQFKKHMGISIYHYRIITRINEAKRLLYYQELSIKEIALKLGYTDQYAFSNQFKKNVGLSPTKFRDTI